MGTKKDWEILIITGPFTSGAPIHPLSNFLDILSTRYHVHLITGNRGLEEFQEDSRCQVSGINVPLNPHIITKIIYFIYLQFWYSFRIIKIYKKAPKLHAVVFFMGTELMVLPRIISKILNIKMFFVLAGNQEKLLYTRGQVLYYWISKLGTELSYKLSTHLIVYSKSAIKDIRLERYHYKVITSHRHFVDFKIFKNIRPVPKRVFKFAYIGRLHKDKGIKELLHGISLIPYSVPILIGGDGDYRETVTWYSKKDPRIRYVGWIPRKDLPEYLNNIQIIVLPSYTEGLPNIVIEGSACGTPALVTPVGSVPDFFTDKKTAFILPSNTPDDIARYLTELIENPKVVVKVGKTAQKFARHEFNFNKVLSRYSKILTR